MVDQTQRRELSQDIRRLVTGRMSNDKFDDVYFDRYKSSQDAAVREIAGFGYGLYSSDVLLAYRLKGCHKVPKDVRRIASRSVLFLRSNLEYEWPSMPDDSDWSCVWALSFNLGLPGSIAILIICAALLVGGDTGFAMQLGIPSLVVLAFCLWIVFGFNQTETSEWKAWKSTGDWYAWPFFRLDDLANARDNKSLA